MTFEVMTYPNKSNLTPSFFIQMKGNYAGRPMNKPIHNCVAVYSDSPYLFELVYLLFKGKKFTIYLKGSVIPFVRINDVREVINIGIEKFNPEKIKLLKKINLFDMVVSNHKEQIRLYQMAQMAVCIEYLR